MRFFLMGATGFIGRNLISHLLESGHEVIILSRRPPENVRENIKVVVGSPLKEGEWVSYADSCEVLVNLVGRPIFTRWTEEAKKEILESRVISTEIASKVVAKSATLKVLINANAIGYYGVTGDRDVTEDDPPGTGFLADVAKKWQDATVEAKNAGKRVVITRFAAVLGKDGGMLGQVVPIFKMGLGGKIGSGKQWFSWVHIKDLCRAIEFTAINEKIEGPVNVTSPQPVTNAEFTKALAKVLNRPAIFPVPPFALKLMFGDVASLSLDSVKVLPKVLISHGFVFKFPDIETALRDLLLEN